MRSFEQSTGTRALVVTCLMATLVVAGVVSFYASTKPDGLNHVARTQGFENPENLKSRRSLDDGSPLARYATRGIDDHRLSKGLAGIAGVAAVLVLATGWTVLLRRRPRERAES